LRPIQRERGAIVISEHGERRAMPARRKQISPLFVFLVRRKIHVAHAARKPRRYGQSESHQEGRPDRKNLDDDHASMSARIRCAGLARRPRAPARSLSAMADNFKTGRDAELMPKGL
jgi:hypothetical protein